MEVRRSTFAFSEFERPRRRKNLTDPIPVTPLPYQSPQQISTDLGHLKALSICHYVYGGMTMFFSCFGLIYIVMGVLILSGNPAMKQAFATPAGPGGPPASSPEFLGYIFTGMGSCVILFGWILGGLAIASGRKIAKRRSRVFSIVMAGID